MKRLILLTIFGILMIRRIQCITNNECETVEAAGNDEGFFSGTWYVTHSKVGGPASLCDQFGTGLQDGTKLIKYSLKDDGSYGIHCEGKPSNKDHPFPYDCTVQSNQKNIPARFTVVSTDGNYALVYKCTKSGFFPTDDYLVLNKQKDAEIPEGVESKLQSLGLDSSSFTSSKSECTQS
uniref:Putative triabin-like lipocalin rhodnius neglectus lipocalin n=2 Tax=Rhodnius TaxID=13248 RepID=A0A4P6DA83_RHOPR